MEDLPVYLDNNATTPLHPDVIAEIQESLHRDWSNPSSSYGRGSKVRHEILSARRSLSLMIGGPVGEDALNQAITFTSGGTESNHLAIHSALEAIKKRTGGKPHVVTTNVEHVAIEKPLRALEADNVIDVTYVEVENGMASAERILAAVRENTCLVSVMLANNETGIINPVGKIMREVKALNKIRDCHILTHSDAAQAIGKIPVDVRELSVDFLTIVGHKFYGPRIGALYHDPKKCEVFPFFRGGGQEFDRRAGTENTPMILGLAKAAEIIFQEGDPGDSLRELRLRLENGLKNNLGSEGIIVNFEGIDRLPNTSSLSFPTISSGKELLNRLEGSVDASTSAACHSAGLKGSGVLIRSGLRPELAQRTLRLSVGAFTNRKDIDMAVKYISAAVKSFNN